jgi:hypothetical protein
MVATADALSNILPVILTIQMVAHDTTKAQMDATNIL